MYQEHGDFEESSSIHGSGLSEAHLPNCNPFEQLYPQNDMDLHLHHHLDLDHTYAGSGGAWEDMSGGFNHNFNQILAATASMADAAFTAPEMLGIFPQLPRSLLPNGGVAYDPLLPLNLPPQPPLLRDLFHSLPNAAAGFYTPLFSNGADEREGGLSAGLYQNDGVFEFAAAEIGNGRDHHGNSSKDTKHFATERHRRVLLNDKYKALRSLIPSPTKQDRASVVGDAIGYINELKRTVGELQGLVEKKRFAQEKLKRPKTEEVGGDHVDPFNGASSLRSSWLHRKSKNTEVDVRIIDDEVTVKLVQQKRINCLLFVSRVLDELQLDLHHVAGGVVGDYYSYLFNSKISEGSIVYASAVANKLIDVVDRQYAAAVPLPPSDSY